MDGVMKTKIINYLKEYGINYVGDTKAPLIKERRSIIPACDVKTLEEFKEIIKQTGDIDKIGAYKVGFVLALRFGLPNLVNIARDCTDKPIIYDHQKGGNDIPDLGGEYAMIMLESGIDAAILFPFAGVVTQYKWTEALKNAGKRVLIGAEMTHQGFKQSEGGSIADEMLDETYIRGVYQGVRDFVIPGNKLARIKHYRQVIEGFGIKPTYMAPGFVAQGGEVTEFAQEAGDNWHAIVGRAITESRNKRQAAMLLTDKLKEYEESLRRR
jgi:orotidine-5'-phosphate decarboxylase